MLAQQFATWGERPASLCGGNTLSSQELQTPCQHDHWSAIIGWCKRQSPSVFSIEVRPETGRLWCSIWWHHLLKFLLCHVRRLLQGIHQFRAVTLENLKKNRYLLQWALNRSMKKTLSFPMLSPMPKSSLSPLWYCQFHLDFQFCHGWVNLNQLKGPPEHLPPGGLPGLDHLADITKIYQNMPKIYQNIPKITPDIPKLCQDMTSCLVASLAWILLQRPRSPRASHLSELNNSQTNNILEATRTLSSNDPFHSYSYQPIRT